MRCSSRLPAAFVRFAETDRAHPLRATRLRRRGRSRIWQAAPQRRVVAEHDRDRLADMLNDSAKAVREAVRARLEARGEMDVHYDHPILMLDDEEIGPVTWDVWMEKSRRPWTSPKARIVRNEANSPRPLEMSAERSEAKQTED
jgi:hypothetical protein